MSIPVSSISDAVEFLRTTANFALQRIHPADSPREARLVRDGTVIDLHVGVARGATIILERDNPPTSRLPNREVVGPDGIIIRFAAPPSLVVPVVLEETTVGDGDAEGAWHVGRAGMEYRDLVPSRLGGAVIASNIRIRTAGPVADYVHHHDVLFQLIFCRRGWVKVVYEDQGEPFILKSGDCVIQPPGIRHRVLENSDGMEVVEIGYPAEHMTNVVHDLTLPNGTEPSRRWHGQAFVRYDETNRTWSSLGNGIERSDTGIHAATAGLADVDVLHLEADSRLTLEPVSMDHPRLVFVVSGSALVKIDGTMNDLPEGSTLSMRSKQGAQITARTSTTLLRVVLDASRDLAYWRPSGR